MSCGLTRTTSDHSERSEVYQRLLVPIDPGASFLQRLSAEFMQEPIQLSISASQTNVGFKLAQKRESLDPRLTIVEISRVEIGHGAWATPGQPGDQRVGHEAEIAPTCESDV